MKCETSHIVSMRHLMRNAEPVSPTREVRRRLVAHDCMTNNDSLEVPSLHPYVYIKDHLGSVRLTVDAIANNNGTGNARQGMEYLPSGEVFRADNYPEQSYMFCGKELMTMHGWNMYDSNARFQHSKQPRFSSIDPLAEKYYSLSPYNYAGNDPVNVADPSGMGWIRGDYESIIFYFYDSRVNTLEDFERFYSNADHTLSFLGDSGYFHVNGVRYDLQSDGNVRVEGHTLKKESFFGSRDSGVIVGGDRYTDMKSVGRNMYGNYLGPDNPKLIGQKEGDSYAVPPVDWQDFNAWKHDRGYDRAEVSGVKGVMSISTIRYDIELAKSSREASQHPSSLLKAFYSTATTILFYNVSKWKFYFNPALSLWYMFASK